MFSMSELQWCVHYISVKFFFFFLKEKQAQVMTKKKLQSLLVKVMPEPCLEYSR